MAIGADGIIVEVHPCPEKALSDGAQSLTIEGFNGMMANLARYAANWQEDRHIR
jgi:3-deoxy-7-phosphoheptulonate synthase